MTELGSLSPAARPISEGEVHLFIIWEKAYFKRNAILRDLATKFRIAGVCELTWSARRFAENLTRFYGTKLPDNSFKEVHCGTGPFTVVVVLDSSPRVAARDTSKGRMDVNTTVFDAKSQYRLWTGGGHRIHATNDAAETSHDLMLLLGDSPASYLQTHWNSQHRSIARDLTGAGGWNSLSELFRVLGACVTYVVLRNFRGLTAERLDEDHPDIDFLTESQQDLAFIANSRKLHEDSARSAFEVYVAGQWVRCDFRSVGDGYYDDRWQSGILRRRTPYRGIFVPGREDYLPSLLYHALVHKQEFGAEARRDIAELALPDDLPGPNLATRADAMQWLCAFMSRKRYDFTMPLDYSVGFNVDGVPQIRSSLRGSLERQARSLARELKHELSRKFSRF